MSSDTQVSSLRSMMRFVANLFRNKPSVSFFKLAYHYRKTGLVMRQCKVVSQGNGNRIIIGNNCDLSGVRFYMCGDNNTISIGHNVCVNASKKQLTSLNACGGCGIYIANDCLLSNSIEVHTSDYHPVYVAGVCSNKPMDVRIGEKSWIGLRSVILKGSVIPDHTVVGCCSLINKVYDEPRTLITGIPAKVVKQDVDWDLSFRQY